MNDGTTCRRSRGNVARMSGLALLFAGLVVVMVFSISQFRAADAQDDEAEQLRQQIIKNRWLILHRDDFRPLSNHYAYLGIKWAPLNERLAKSHGLQKNQGIIVTGVDLKSPADKAGMKLGDTILAVNEHPIHTVEGDLLRAGKSDHTHFYLPGDTVTYTVIRGGDKLEIRATLSCKTCGDKCPFSMHQ